MARPGFVDAEDLRRWAESFSVRADLPRLVRRLIFETCSDIVHLGFRAGAGVSLGGWDGTVRASEASAHIPDGLSLWELSTAKDVKQKADDDFEKRTDPPDGSSSKDCTYIEVTLRRWPGLDAWAAARRREGKWKDVRAYDVDNLETWLETAPVTHAWISELLGLAPHGLRAAENWWNAWSSATDPAIPYSVVLAGREKAAEELTGRLGQQAQIVTVRGASIDEVLALVSAVAASEVETDGGSLLARTAFVDQVDTWRRLRDHKNPLVLVPTGDAVAAEVAAGSLHHLIVPVIGTMEADIELPPVDSTKAAEILKAAGLEERKAEEAGRLARFSLLALRRRLALKPELHSPQWAVRPVSGTIRRLLLAGRWNENHEADQHVVANLVGEDYGALREEIAQLAAQEDPLVGSVGSSLGLVSAYDAWLLFRETLRPRGSPTVRSRGPNRIAGGGSRIRSGSESTLAGVHSRQDAKALGRSSPRARYNAGLARSSWRTGGCGRRLKRG